METKKNWPELIQEYRASGLTGIQWCEKNGFKIHTLRYHIGKLNKENKKVSHETKWASIVPEESAVNGIEAKPLKIIIGQSTIEVAQGFDPDTLKAVVEVLYEKC